MNPRASDDQRRERLVARLLWLGTWIASAIIAVGLALRAMQHVGHAFPHGPDGLAVMKAGVALFIALPVGRVALMLFTFLREKDVVYALIAGLVLAIIAAGVLAAL
ncbi:DUF1634 domain-containing protein [Rhodanobacter sp. DHG33]|uniref:DUF1634 domain-containing protein n=1 Tax=Rhodanobacter sp. DHG33 TaxID=2775921 RepID=UPI0017868C71|nr:DUF1634 domain-containing protein [Rhodanobacter sp. DHG33]MBD8897498.1 DUF1634 domain-containing protein [Rhodanobacter sp. DHG33]